MFNKLKTSGLQTIRSVKELAGKAAGFQEDEKFQAKVVSLAATSNAFKNLQKVGLSIFKTENLKKKQASENNDFEPVVNPADDFVAEVGQVLTLEKAYKKKRLAWDVAKDQAASAAEAAKNPTAKNAEKKEAHAEQCKQTEVDKKQEYDSAKELLLQGIDKLEEQRDAKFKESVDAMCSILNGLKPDWEAEGEGANEYADVIDQKDDDVAVDPPQRQATDSESD